MPMVVQRQPMTTTGADSMVHWNVQNKASHHLLYGDCIALFGWLSGIHWLTRRRQGRRTTIENMYFIPQSAGE